MQASPLSLLHLVTMTSRTQVSGFYCEFTIYIYMLLCLSPITAALQHVLCTYTGSSCLCLKKVCGTLRTKLVFLICCQSESIRVTQQINQIDIMDRHTVHSHMKQLCCCAQQFHDKSVCGGKPLQTGFLLILGVFCSYPLFPLKGKKAQPQWLLSWNDNML